MIWIIGGTGESSELSRRISDMEGVVFTVATPEALEFNQAQDVHVGRMDKEAMRAFAKKRKVSLIIDMSHPFAVIVSENARSMAQEEGIKYVRYHRGDVENFDSALYLDDYQACQDYLRTIRGNVLFTTGSKGIGDFQAVRGDNRFIYRILPTAKSMAQAQEAGVDMKDLLGMLGPFSFDMNRALIREYEIDYLVTKDSGAKSGFEEKIRACQAEGVQALVIARKEEGGLGSLDEVEDLVRRTHGGIL